MNTIMPLLKTITLSTMIMFLFSIAVIANDKPNKDPIQAIVIQGVKNSFGLKSQELRLEKTLNGRWDAYTDLLPTVSATGNRNIQTSDKLEENVKYSERTFANSLQVKANWTIWNHFENIRNIRVAQYNVDADRINSQKAIQEYIISLLEKYLDYQVLLMRRTTLRGSLEQSKWSYNQAQTLIKTGAKSPMETLDSEIDVINAERDLMELEQSIDSALRDLRIQINSDHTINFDAIDLLNAKPYFFETFEQQFPGIKRDWQQKLGSVNPLLRSVMIDLEKSQADLLQSRLNLLPKTSIQLSHEINLDSYVQKTPGVPTTPLHNTAISLSFTWEIWNWLKSYRSERNSSYDKKITENTLKENTLKMHSELQSIIEQHELIEKSVQASQLALEKALSQLEYLREMYKVGRLNLLNLQQAQSRYTDARTSLATRLKFRYVLAAKILYQMGYSLVPNKQDVDWAY